MADEIVDAQVGDESNTDAEVAPVATTRDEIYKSITASREHELREELAGGAGVESPDVVDATVLSPLVYTDGQWIASAKIDGEEQQVQFDDLLRNYQKAQAADRRLEQAAQMRKQLEQRAVELQAWEQQLTARSQPPEVDNGAVSSSRDRAKGITDAIFSGEEDATVEAITQLLDFRHGRETATPVIGPAEIARYVDQQLDARRKLDEQQQAIQVFQSEFKPIWEDPKLLHLADTETARMYAESPARPMVEIVREAGRTVEAWLGSAKAQIRAEVEQEKKRTSAAYSTPATSGRASLGSPDSIHPTSTDIIAKMREQRGQKV